MKISILILLLFISNITFADNVDRYSTAQPSILFSTSNVCHAKNLGNHYKKMLLKVTPVNSIYVLKSSLSECITDGGRLDKKYSKHFPELSLLETQVAISSLKIKLDNELNKTNPDPAIVKALQENLEVYGKLENKEEVAAQKAEEQVKKSQENTNQFYGFNWAPGIAVMNYKSSYIDDIRIETTGEGDTKINRVFVDREVDVNMAIVLETHYLWPFKIESLNRDSGVGLFAATNLVKQEGAPLTMFAFGPMFSVRDKDSPTGFSIGLAYFVDTDFKVLRDNLSDGDVTTYEDSAKLTRRVDESGWMLMISSKF